MITIAKMPRNSILCCTLAAAILLTSCSSTPPAKYRVKLETSKGDVVVEVNREWSPLGADRFHELVGSGFYDGARFFRVLPGFVVQFGLAADPALNAKWANVIADDPPGQTNAAGTITFATRGAGSRTTQVFINLKDNPILDQKGFTPFGRVVEGMNFVQQFYADYGEGAPNGNGPAQDRIRAEGNAYLERDFPKLDFIKKATLLK
jgi:peptidyl-prolyl cis-trans isomerase A (cyclophilin A)